MELRRRLKDALLVHRSAIFAHHVRGVKVAADFVPDIVPTGSDVDHADRLLAAYNLAMANAPATKPEDLWTSIARQQRSFFEVLTSGDPQRLATYLCNMSRHDATQGTVQGSAEYRHLRHSAGYRRFVARMAKDKLVSLAEAVGAVPCENPEQGVWGHNFQMRTEDLVSRVSAALGMDITPPAIDGGLFKISTGPEQGAGRFGERDCNAIYTAWALTQLLEERASGAAVCEIGGGSGRVAYWARRFGIDDYTIYDLPQVNAVQGFYLMKALGGEAVRLYGESHAQGQGGICGLDGGAQVLLFDIRVECVHHQLHARTVDHLQEFQRLRGEVDEAGFEPVQGLHGEGDALVLGIARDLLQVARAALQFPFPLLGAGLPGAADGGIMRTGDRRGIHRGGGVHEVLQVGDARLLQRLVLVGRVPPRAHDARYGAFHAASLIGFARLLVVHIALGLDGDFHHVEAESLGLLQEVKVAGPERRDPEEGVYPEFDHGRVLISASHGGTPENGAQSRI